MTSALPPPAGPFGVGRISREWTDQDRTDPYAPEPAEPRRLVTWIWYPSEPGAPAPYLPDGWQASGQMLGVRADGLASHSTDGGELSTARTSYPVVLLSPSGFTPLLLSATAEDLASQGFVVVGVNHPYETEVTVFADGRTVGMNPAAIAGAIGPQAGDHREVFARRAEVCRYKTADLAFLAGRLGDLFPGRLDLDRLTAVGHSFGGAAALQWCRDDPRCRAAVNLDGALWTEVGRSGLPRPVLQLLAPHPEFDAAPSLAPDPAWFTAERDITVGGWATIDRTGRPAHSLRIAGATHLSFMDVPFLPLAEDAMVRPMLAATSIDPAALRTVVSTLLAAFLAGDDLTPVLKREPLATLTTPLTPPAG